MTAGKRAGSMSDDDRALIGAPRRQTPVRGVPLAAPHEVDEGVTGVLSGEALARARARRPTPDRLAHVETRQDEHAEQLRELDRKHDKLAAEVADWRVETSENLGSIRGGIGELTGAVNGLRIVVENAAKRDHVTFKARVDVDKAQALDTIDARKGKRDLRNKLLAAVLTGGGLTAVAIKVLSHWGVL